MYIKLLTLVDPRLAWFTEALQEHVYRTAVSAKIADVWPRPLGQDCTRRSWPWPYVEGSGSTQEQVSSLVDPTALEAC